MQILPIVATVLVSQVAAVPLALPQSGSGSGALEAREPKYMRPEWLRWSYKLKPKPTYLVGGHPKRSVETDEGAGEIEARSPKNKYLNFLNAINPLGGSEGKQQKKQTGDGPLIRGDMAHEMGPLFNNDKRSVDVMPAALETREPKNKYLNFLNAINPLGGSEGGRRVGRTGDGPLIRGDMAHEMGPLFNNDKRSVDVTPAALETRSPKNKYLNFLNAINPLGGSEGKQQKKQTGDGPLIRGDMAHEMGPLFNNEKRSVETSDE